MIVAAFVSPSDVDAVNRVDTSCDTGREERRLALSSPSEINLENIQIAINTTHMTKQFLVKRAAILNAPLLDRGSTGDTVGSSVSARFRLDFRFELLSFVWKM